MKKVKIADLKAHLSAYLREVRAGGEMIVADRDTPIAVLSPYHERKGDFRVAPPRKPGLLLKNFKGIKPAKVFDVVEYLLEDRRSRG